MIVGNTINNDKIPAVFGTLEPRKIYPVTEEELKLLERGSDGSLQLNFAIAFLTSAVSALIAYLTISSTLPFIALAFIIAIIFSGFGFGFFLLLVWYRKAGNQKRILEKIRARIEEEKLQSLLSKHEKPKPLKIEA